MPWKPFHHRNQPRLCNLLKLMAHNEWHDFPLHFAFHRSWHGRCFRWYDCYFSQSQPVQSRRSCPEHGRIVPHPACAPCAVVFVDMGLEHNQSLARSSRSCKRRALLLGQGIVRAAAEHRGCPFLFFPDPFGCTRCRFPPFYCNSWKNNA